MRFMDGAAQMCLEEPWANVGMSYNVVRSAIEFDRAGIFKESPDVAGRIGVEAVGGDRSRSGSQHTGGEEHGGTTTEPPTPEGTRGGARLGPLRHSRNQERAIHEGVSSCPHVPSVGKLITTMNG